MQSKLLFIILLTILVTVLPVLGGCGGGEPTAAGTQSESVETQNSSTETGTEAVSSPTMTTSESVEPQNSPTETDTGAVNGTTTTTQTVTATGQPTTIISYVQCSDTQQIGPSLGKLLLFRQSGGQIWFIGPKEDWDWALYEDSLDVAVTLDQRLSEAKAATLEKCGVQFRRENGGFRELVSTYQGKTSYSYYARVPWEQVCLLVDDPDVTYVESLWSPPAATVLP